MNPENENNNPVLNETAPAFYMGDIDQETFEILIDDKIATGG